MNRPTKDEYYLGIAAQVLRRSTCLRRWYGSVLVSACDNIISTGFNGAARGEAHCNICERQRLMVPAGERYELCKAVHSEMNCCLFANPRDREDAILYLCGFG